MDSQIRQEIENVNWKNNDSVINFYEKNTVYFDNYDIIKNIDQLIEIADIKLSYIMALDSKRHYTKADKYLKDFQNININLSDTESFERINERYLFACGIIAQRLKKHDESQTYFKKLIKIDPENDLYKEWYESNKDSIFYNKSKVIGYIGSALFFICVFGKSIIPLDKNLIFRVELLGFIMAIGGLYGYRLRKYLIKKEDKK